MARLEASPRIFEYSFEGEKNPKDAWGIIIPDRGNSRCKGPVVES